MVPGTRIRRDNQHIGAHAPPIARAGMSTTAMNSSATSASSASSNTTKVPIIPIVGGLAAGVVLVVVALAVWWCCRKASRRQNRQNQNAMRASAVPLDNDLKRRPSLWRAEDSFSASVQKNSYDYAAMDSSRPPRRQPPIHLDLRKSSSSERNGGSMDNNRYDRSSASGYSASSLPYDLVLAVSPPSSPTSPITPPSPTQKAKVPSYHSNRSKRKSPPRYDSPPSSPTNSLRPYAPTRPSPLAQASLLASAVVSPIPAPIVTQPPPSHAKYSDSTPPSSSPAVIDDPFSSSPQRSSYYRYDEEPSYDDNRYSRHRVSGVGYAI